MSTIRTSIRDHIEHGQRTQAHEQIVRMVDVGKRLRARARHLNLSDAEVARRAGLSARRYGFYVTGDRHPDFQTFAKICCALDTTPNYLLGFEDEQKLTSGLKKKRALTDRLSATANLLEPRSLQLVVDHADLVLNYQASQAG